MLGGTPVLIDPGVALMGSEKIGCNFGGIEVTGEMRGSMALCVSPTLQNVGHTPFRFSISGRDTQETDFLSGMLLQTTLPHAHFYCCYSFARKGSCCILL